ncbi:MAG: cadmium resistance transporter [Arcanobacterium sp.]|nr:cadmium resistance transporter [Arcanobacterium sp.]MDY5588567.1 cadmium resistance transporter [Arcanobacterium sp.]
MLITFLTAIGLFAVTNIDHLLVLSIFFAHGAKKPHTLRQIMIGQYIGFAAILGLTIAGAIGTAVLLPSAAIPWFGILPLVIGIRAAISSWQAAHGGDTDDELHESAEKIAQKPLSIMAVAAVTFANGGDEIGVYLPVFVGSTWIEITLYCGVFLVLVAAVVALARYVTSRPSVAEFLEHFESIIFPAVLIALGLGIIISGLFGL